VNAKPVPGKDKAKVKLPGSNTFVTVDSAQDLPAGTTIDVSGNAAIDLTDPNGQTMTFQGQLTNGRSDGVSSDFVYQGVKNGVVQLSLTGGSFSKFSRTSASVHAKAKKPVRRLWGSGKGKFTTKGKYAAATVRGTIWEVADFKDGTLCLVKRGLVVVQDFVTHKTKLVKAGQSYFAASKPAVKKTTAKKKTANR
jgi:hypothetical protein